MRKLVLALLLCASAAWGQSVELPKEIKADPGLVILQAKSDCTSLQWVSLDPGLQLIPPDLLKDSKTGCAVVLTAGRYRVLAYGARGDKASPPAITLVVVGQPGPGPDPNPTPDPADPLQAKLQTAYSQAPDSVRLVRYRDIFAGAGTIVDASQTTGQALDSMRALSASSVGGDALIPLRRAVGDYLNTVLPVMDVPITPELNAQLKREFAKVANLLGKVK